MKLSSAVVISSLVAMLCYADPQADAKRLIARPALVLTDQGYNRASGLVVVCPLTRTRKPYPFALPVVVDQVEGRSWWITSRVWIGKRATWLPLQSRTGPAEPGPAYVAVFLRLR